MDDAFRPSPHDEVRFDDRGEGKRTRTGGDYNTNPSPQGVESFRNDDSHKNLILRLFGPQIRLLEGPIRTACVATIAFLAITITAYREILDRGVWVVVTVFVLTGNQPTSGRVFLVCVLRAVGTITGAVLGIGLAAFVWYLFDCYQCDLVPLFVEALVFFSILGWTSLSKLYIKPEFGYAPLIGLVTVFMAFQPSYAADYFEFKYNMVGLQRCYQVLVGIIISAVCEFLILPQSSVKKARVFLSAGFKSLSSSVSKCKTFMLDFEVEISAETENVLTHHLLLTQSPFLKALAFINDAKKYEKIEINCLHWGLRDNEKISLLYNILRCGLRAERLLIALVYQIRYAIFTPSFEDSFDKWGVLLSNAIDNEVDMQRDWSSDVGCGLSCMQQGKSHHAVVDKFSDDLRKVFQKLERIYMIISELLDKDYYYRGKDIKPKSEIHREARNLVRECELLIKGVNVKKWECDERDESEAAHAENYFYAIRNTQALLIFICRRMTYFVEDFFESAS
eukprot:Nk52_evm17s2402 gene=Nk52_evmTU17s2402